MKKFESPLEVTLYEKISSYVGGANNTRIEIQVPAKTVETTYRLDMVVYCQGRMIGFECDGSEFHSGFGSYYKDIFRDSCLLLDTDIKTIFRISGKDIHNEEKLPICLFMANKYEPFITDPNRQTHCLTECLTMFAHNQYCDQSETIEGYDYAQEGMNQIGRSGMLISYYAVDQDHCVSIGYRTKETLQKYCNFIEANRNLGLSIDEIRQKYIAEEN